MVSGRIELATMGESCESAGNAGTGEKIRAEVRSEGGKNTGRALLRTAFSMYRPSIIAFFNASGIVPPLW